MHGLMHQSISAAPRGRTTGRRGWMTGHLPSFFVQTPKDLTAQQNSMNFKYLCQKEIKSIKIWNIIFMERSWLFTFCSRFVCTQSHLSNQNKVINIPTNMFSAYTYKRNEHCVNDIDRFYRTLVEHQGHPTTIFGKYLFGRRFEI